MNKRKSHKGILILSVLLLFIIMGAASASSDNAIISDDNINDETLTLDDSVSEDTVSTDTKSEQNEVLSDVDSFDNGTFTELNDKIQNEASFNGVIKLEKDYTFDPDVDFKLGEGIIVPAYLTIDGQGHTIVSNDSLRVFQLLQSNIILKNIIFESRASGATVYVVGDHCEIMNSEFNNNTRPIWTVADSSLTVIDSYFINGGSVLAEGNIIVKNSIFENIDGGYPGALQTIQNVEVYDSKFINNTGAMGSAIYHVNSDYDLIVDNCTFINNTARYLSGTIFSTSPVTNITNSRFINNRNAFNVTIGYTSLNEYGNTYENNNYHSFEEGIRKGESFNLTENTYLPLKPNVGTIDGVDYSVEIKSDNIVIDGNGFTVGGVDNGFLKISGNNITIKNIIFYDFYARGDIGAVQVVGKNVTFINVTFNDCQSRSGGSLCVGNAGNVTVINSTFIGGGSDITTEPRQIRVNNGYLYLYNITFDGISEFNVRTHIADHLVYKNLTFIDSTKNVVYSYVDNEYLSSDEFHFVTSDYVQTFSGLSHDYTLTQDWNVTNTALLNESNIIIDGAGHIIDGKGKEIFSITGNNITLKNLILCNAVQLDINSNNGSVQ